MATPAFTNSNSPLKAQICELIQKNGPIPFRQYMELALFDPDHGYYTSESKTVGKEGDFITSVSVGHCFGLILARRLIQFWEDSNRPACFSIIEPGAHNGSLCADILQEIKTQSPVFYDTVHYHLVETSNHIQSEQSALLSADYHGKFTAHTSLDDVRADHGVIISNELIDAFPVELIKFKDEEWWQMYVSECNGELKFTEQKTQDNEITDFCQSLGNSFPDDYLTEYSPSVRSFAHEASAALQSGLIITIDYGYQAEEYYHPSRMCGSLQTYYQHQKSDNPLDNPGELDITCHINFSHLTEELSAQGFTRPSLLKQASYLTLHARGWLGEIEARFDELEQAPALLRQFQTLTHPAMLGTKFMVLEMIK
jgi:SAM-dependent MidA family methyltransferase